MGSVPAARRFYDVHVVADEHHGPLAMRELVGGYLEEQPQDAAALVWGSLVLLHVESRFAEQLLGAWSVGEASLRAVEGEPDQRAASRVPRSSPTGLNVASRVHRWYSARDWPRSWTSNR